ncbi:PilN domain-containing protein [Patescibacteria group bacterium]|nr:PilN domain-containing protein [Patescibacteria group bacterium]
MITLNLISPSQKHLLKIKQFYQILKNFLSVLTIYSLILSIILIPLNQKIYILKEDVNNRKREVQFKNKNISDNVLGLNKQIETLSQILSEFFNWPNYLINLSALAPAGVSLNHLSASLDNKEFIINGYASTRDDLIILKNNLENSPLFEEITIPLSNFLTQQGVTFEIKGKIK